MSEGNKALSSPIGDRHSWTVRANRLVYWVSRHWLLVISLLIGIYVGLPWLAPLFMEVGWTGAGKAIYLLYATQCHQLPERSFFLFGPKPMYALNEIQAAWQNTNNPLILRRFIGNPEMGWKVAWSDRMVSMYSTLIFWGGLFWPLRQRVKPLPWWALVLFLLPMTVDGITHMISDFTGGIGSGFRDSNAWLAPLTHHTLPATFYAGDALGSFNSWLRLTTGILFGLGVVWFIYPRLHRAFSDTASQIETKLQKAGLEA
jgi:uncharacterized membrane protein